VNLDRFCFQTVEYNFQHGQQPYHPVAKTGCPLALKLCRAESGYYLDGRPSEKARLLLEEVLVRPVGGAHSVVCVGPKAPV